MGAKVEGVYFLRVRRYWDRFAWAYPPLSGGLPLAEDPPGRGTHAAFRGQASFSSSLCRRWE